MHLTPQHFQAQRRYQEDQATRTLDLLFPYAYGVSAIVMDAEALRNGSLSIVHLRGVLPDGTVVHAPGSDVVPQPLTLAEHFSPTRDAHVVHLALPPLQRHLANVSDAATAGDALPTRYTAVEEVTVDEATGADPLTIRFAARNLLLRLDDQVGEQLMSMPIARVRRDGRGQYQLDPEYVPPTLQVGASDRLLRLLRDTVALLDEKGGALAASMSQAPSGAVGGAAAYVGNELATRWLLHAVRSANAPLRHLLVTRRAHPERLYLELSRLAGALCTFALDAYPRSLPLYDHDDLTGCFDALEKHIRLHLGTVISSRGVIVPLQQTSDVMHTGMVNDPRCYEPGARWFLAVRAQVGRGDLVDRVQRLTKTSASWSVPGLVTRAWDGLPTHHVPTPPAGIAPKPDFAYFELGMSGPHATALAQSKEIGVYVPDALPGAYIEVAVLVPE